MKPWKRVVLVVMACIVTVLGGAHYSGANRAVISSLLSCFGILFVTWMEFPASRVDHR